MGSPGGGPAGEEPASGHLGQRLRPDPGALSIVAGMLGVQGGGAGSPQTLWGWSSSPPGSPWPGQGRGWGWREGAAEGTGPAGYVGPLETPELREHLGFRVGPGHCIRVWGLAPVAVGPGLLGVVGRAWMMLLGSWVHSTALMAKGQVLLGHEPPAHTPCLVRTGPCGPGRWGRSRAAPGLTRAQALGPALP